MEVSGFGGSEVGQRQPLGLRLRVVQPGGCEQVNARFLVAHLEQLPFADESF